jgi:hypothetical protein
MGGCYSGVRALYLLSEGRIIASVAAYFFSPPGRRWPEGSDEGATLAINRELAPSSRCRDLLPGGEKKQAAYA